MSIQNRRQFLTRSAGLIASVPMVSYIGTLSAEPAMLSENEPIAIALGYKANAEEVDVVKFPKRSGVAGRKQYCDNCSLYSKQGPASGTCSAIPGKLVEGKGWCNAWVPQQ